MRRALQSRQRDSRATQRLATVPIRTVPIPTVPIPTSRQPQKRMAKRNLTAANQIATKSAALILQPRETKRRVDLLIHLWAKVSSAIDEGVAYVIVEAQ